MKCHYCEKDLVDVYREATSPQTTITNLMCYFCKVHYEYIITAMEEPLLSRLAFYGIKIEEREFEVQFSFVGKGTIVKRITTRPHPPGIVPSPTKTIVFILPFIPKNWDPFNIQRKLELYLPFA